MTAGGDSTKRSGDDRAPDDPGDSTTESLSWNVGPADSRTIRVCYYLFEAFAGGAVLATAFEYGRAFLPTAPASNPWALGALSLAALALAWRFWRWLLTRGERPGARAGREWLAVRRWWVSLAAAMGVAAALVALERSVARPHWSGPYSTWFFAVFVAVALGWPAELLSSEGELDAESLTFSAPRYGREREVDLRTLTSVRHVTVGEFAVLWLSASPGVEKRSVVQGLYAMPAETFERAKPAFEAGVAAPVPLDADTVERARFFRRVNRAVLVAFVAGAVGAFGLLFWIRAPVYLYLQWLWGFVVFGALLFKLAL